MVNLWMDFFSIISLAGGTFWENGQMDILVNDYYSDQTTCLINERSSGNCYGVGV